MSEMIDQYLDELETSKEDIKQSLINKGVTPTGGLTSYAEAVDSIKSNLGTATVSITKNGTQTITAEEYGYDGMSKVDVTVQVATGGSGKPQIFNGFRFTGGDIAQVDFSQYDWSVVYDTSTFFSGCTHSTGDWTNFEENFNGEILSGNEMFYNFSGTSIPNIGYPIYLAESMFSGCSKLTTIPQLDTSKVTSMRNMFYNCSSLTTIPLLDTSRVMDMYGMFYNCSTLTTIPLLDTSKVTTMNQMFRGCSKLTTIPQLDTSKVTDMYYMFAGCSSLTTTPQLDTSNVTNMYSMFADCSSLTTFPQLDTSKVTTINQMFQNCSSLTSIPQLDFRSYTGTVSLLCSSCTSLVEVGDINFENATYLTGIFKSCSNLTSIGDVICPNNKTFFGSYSSDCWVNGCTKLQKIGVIDCDSVINLQYFFVNTMNELTDFGGCRNLGKVSSISYTNSDYFMAKLPNLTYESVMNVINGLYDRASAGLSVLTLKLHANHLAMLSEDDIAIATNKGWTIV